MDKEEIENELIELRKEIEDLKDNSFLEELYFLCLQSDGEFIRKDDLLEIIQKVRR